MNAARRSRAPVFLVLALTAAAALLAAIALLSPARRAHEGGTSVNKPTVPIEPTTPPAREVAVSEPGGKGGAGVEPEVLLETPAPLQSTQPPGRSGPGPPELGLEEPVFEWGSVLQGEIVTHPFTVENTGGSPLEITGVKPTCDCMTVDHDRVILPGESGVITLKLDTRTLSGTVKKTAALRTNADAPSRRLTMQGEVERVLSVEPELARMNVVRGLRSEPLVIRLERAANHPIAIRGVTSASEFVRTELKEIETGKLWHLEVTAKLPASAKKYFYADLEVEVEVGVEARSFDLPLRVTITVNRRITATPASVYFSRRDTEHLAQPDAPPVKRTVKIACLDPDRSFTVTDVQVRGTHFECALETVEEGKVYNVIVRLSRLPADGPRRIVEKIIVYTDDPAVREVRFNAMASIGRAPAPVTPPGAGREDTHPQEPDPGKEIPPKTIPPGARTGENK